MHFIAISINHRTADVALREQVAFRDDALRLAHEDLYETKIGRASCRERV